MNSPYGSILVVEDVPNIRDLLEVTLSFKGYPVRTAVNGQDALKKIAEERPALIISDIMMPIMDGFGLAQRIRSDPELKGIPLILISATYVSPDDKKFARRLGAVRFLEKPVDTDEFLLTVAEILTQGPPELPEPIADIEFYRGYKDRLEHKLRQKNRQIARTEGLLRKLREEQKPAFQKMLEEELVQRTAIQQELDHLYRILDEHQGNGR